MSKSELLEKLKKGKEKVKNDVKSVGKGIHKVHKNLTGKTTIGARVLRLTLINAFTVGIVISALMLIIMYNYVTSSSRNEAELHAISYASAISNADIAANKSFLDSLFIDFDANNSFGGYGFAVTEKGGVFSETSSDVIKKGDNLITLGEDDKGYAEIKDLLETNKEKIGTAVLKICGEKCLVGWSRIANYEECYTMIVLPYKNVIRSFYQAFNIGIAVFIPAVIIITIVAIRIAKSITGPISGACRRLEELANGDLTTPAPTTDRNDETYILLSSLSNTIERVRTYIDDISVVLSGISGGDLLVRPQAEYSGDFIAIKDSLENILNALNGTFSEVNRAALQVKDCSGQVSDGATTLSQSASVEATTMEKLSVSISEVAVKISANAKNAEEASIMTRSADEFVVKGNESMDAMLEAIREIETSSEQISKIIKVIDDIAFQTNILALNAAVEAARAGTAGKGFAVVADEVRNLATRSAEAAAQTGKLINASTESVRRGTALAEETSEALGKIVEVVENITGIMNGIAVSANEQAAAVSEINQGVYMINDSIQTTSATAVQSAAASEELSGQSDILNSMINKFRFRR